MSGDLTDTPDTKPITVNFPMILNVMGLGVRRASAFMALGLRISRDEAIKSVALEEGFQFRFLPDTLSDDSIKNIQANFEKWIISGSLRELDQSCSLFCDKLYEALVLVENFGKPVTETIWSRLRTMSAKTNVSEKIAISCKEFPLKSSLLGHMAGWSKARNALSHNMGVVASRHTTHKGELRLTWLGPDVLLNDKKIEKMPFEAKDGGKLSVVVAERQKVVPVGTAIEFSSLELSELCWNYWNQANELVGSAQVFARKGGVAIVEQKVETV